MNKRLIVGIILVTLIMFIAVFGSWIAPYDINHREKVAYNNGDVHAPPFPPSTNFVFGTDKYGYDMLTKILNGAKFTVFTPIVISFLRILIGGIIGILMGIKAQKKKRKSILAIAWGALPTFLLVYVLLYPINMQRESKELSYSLFLITIIIFVLVGLPNIIANFRDRTKIVMNNEYINAAKVLGANSKQLMLKHIFPQMKESIITLFITEIVLVLTLYGQLGLFNIFIGGTTMYLWPVEYHSITNEWAGLIGQFRMFIYSKQWILLTPMIALLTLIFSYQILTDGLREFYNKKLNNNSYLN